MIRKIYKQVVIIIPVTDGRIVVDGLRPWNNLQDTLQGFTLRLDHEDYFTAVGKVVPEANVDLMLGN